VTLEASQDIETNKHLCNQADIQDTHIISDGEEELSNEHEQSQDIFRPHEPAPNDKASDTYAAAEKHNEMREENRTNFMDNLTEKPVHVIDDTDERLLAADNPQAELLRWHYRLRHISFTRLCILALLGTIPRKLIHAKTPKCAGCMYGAMTKQPWRTKAQQDNSKIKSVTRPGDCLSIDQLESPTPGFVAQLKGALTKKQYRAATVFVNHASQLSSYIHLQQGLTSAETVEAKRAFKAYARSHGVSIKHYHADNGRFADNAFIDSVARSGQTISYCGVNAHFQNGVAEKRIRDLQEQARKQLLHAKSRWPSAIEINLWPYALRTANDIRNTIPDKEDGSSPLE
jgi:hypothetical protein